MYRDAALSLAGTIVAVVALAPAHTQAPSKLTSINRPEAGTVQTGYVGQRIFSSDTTTVVPGARIRAAVTKSIFIETYRVDAYQPMIQVRSRIGFKACLLDGGVCLLDADGDGTFDRIAEDVSSKAYQLDAPAAYEKISVGDPRSTVARTVTLRNVSSSEIVLEYEQTTGGDYDTREGESYTVKVNRYPMQVRVRDIVFSILGLPDGRLKYSMSIDPPGS